MVEKRTLWPLGILLIIVLGIVLIAVSIRISTQQSIDSDHTFDRKRLEVNTHINDIMLNQNKFEHTYRTYIGINELPNAQSPLMQGPYYITPVPRDSSKEKSVLKGDNDTVYLYFEKNDEIQSEFEIAVVTLEFVRLVQGDKEVTSLSVPVQKVEGKEGFYMADSITLPLKGYYQARFTVEVQNTTTKENQQYPVYFYHWIFNDK